MRFTTLQLRHAGSTLVLCPDAGGAVASFDWRGHAVLRPAPAAALAAGDVRRMGMYPLVPYSNRIGAGRLPLDGGSLALRPNFPPEPHSIHGFGWQRGWSVDPHGAAYAELSLEHAPDADWPYPCVARQSLRLGDGGLELRLSVRNTGAAPMPAGLGFHPYFPVAPGLRLQTAWRGRWDMGPDQLPQGRAPVPAPALFATPAAVAGWRSDHCYTGWNRSATLLYQDHQVQLRAGPACPSLVCFAPDDERAFIALEPVSHVNNAFVLAAQGVPGTGMRILAPGQEFAIEVSIEAGPRELHHA